MQVKPETCYEITHLEWERLFLRVEFSALEPPTEGCAKEQDRFFALRQGNQLIAFEVEERSPGSYLATLNMAVMDGRSFLSNGTWEFVAGTSDELETGKAHPLGVSTDAAYASDDLSKVFRYGGDRYAYTVSFQVKEMGEGQLSLLLESVFMERNESWGKRRYIKEVDTLPAKVKRAAVTFAIGCAQAFYDVMRAFAPKKGTRILIMDETKDYLWGNLKRIDERIKERGLDSRFSVSYSLRNIEADKQGLMSWIKLIATLAKQDIVIVDSYAIVLSYLRLSKDTKLIQVWHAGAGFKAIGYCRFGKEGSPFPVGSVHRRYTQALAGSKELVPVFEEVFGIEKEAIKPLGMPRLDTFLDEEVAARTREQFYAQYPELKDRKLILYAPTYRGKGQQTAYNDYSKLDLARIYDFCGNEYAFLFKMHPFVTSRPEIPTEYQDRVYDISNYPHMNDLYYVADILITDYSSSYYEYSLMGRPILFYTYDRAFYELTRGVYQGVKESAPGKVCDTFDELMEALQNQDFELEKTLAYREENFPQESPPERATDRFIDEILLDNEVQE